MRFRTLYLGALLLAAAACNSLKDGEYNLTLLTTNDVHGHYFDSTYVGTDIERSLFAVNACVDSVRAADGADHVILVDAGDCLQGDNASYYFNYVDTLTPHVYPRMARYMGYDALAVGNHDIETGHRVYDRIAAQFRSYGIPYLAGNAIRNDNGNTYFPSYTVVRRGGLKVAILGFTNPNMKSWLNESVWSGMHFDSLIPLVQEEVDRVVAKENPQVVIVVTHSGTGAGNGRQLDSQGLDLLHSLRGVDFLVCSHDHRPYTENAGDICLINSGSHCRNLGYGSLRLTVRNGKVVSREHGCRLIPIRAGKVDKEMRAAFHDDYEAVKAFTLREVGELKCDLRTRDAYRGMSDYTNLIHTLQLGCSPAQISFSAPLTYNGFVKAGTLVYDDLFTIYPYENQLFVIRMTGEEIKNYLEYSYDKWIQTATQPGDHVLRIVEQDDARTSQRGWSFVNRSYNFDSAAGLNYTVDVTRPFGKRVSISSMASGQPFEPGKEYFVALTSYRASGGGGLLSRGAGIDTDRIDERVVSRYPEVRNILYQYLLDMGSIDPAVTGDPVRIGSWKFVPEPFAKQAIDRDMNLLFPPRRGR